MTKPRPEGKTREAVEMDLLVELSCREWHDVTDVSPDPDAIQCLAHGIIGKQNGETIFYLTRYADKGAEYALVSQAEKRGPEGKAITTEQFKLEWLWQQVAPPRPLPASEQTHHPRPVEEVVDKTQNQDETVLHTVTLTVRRPDQDITVGLRYTPDVVGGVGLWTIEDILDEDGSRVHLTQQESIDCYMRAKAGEDETGR